MSKHTAFASKDPAWPDLVIIGGANTDCTMKMEAFPQAGKAARADHFQCLPGGKGLNQAIAASRLGARVALIAILGDDHHADEILERLEAEGIDTRYAFRTSNAHTGATTILVDNEGKSLRSAFPSANRLLLPQQIDAASEVMCKAGMLLAQLEVPVATVRHAFELARRSGVRTMLDAEEAATLSGRDASTPHDALVAAGTLLARGPEIVAVGTGDGGNAVLTSEALHRYEPDAAQVTDMAGAGDAFSAAFAVAMLEGKDVQAAGAMAHAASGYAIGALGALASLPSRRELEAQLGCGAKPAATRHRH